MRLRDRKKVTQIIRQIHRIFPKHTGGRKPRLEAAQALSQIEGSHVTIIRARKALGIKSQKIAGRWCWLYPTRTLAQALDYMALRHVHNKSNAYKAPQDYSARDAKEAQQQLTDYFTNYANYSSSALDAREYLKGVHIYTTGKAISTARREMEVANRMIDGHWHWVWGGPAVQEWLQELLSDGPIKECDILASALAEKKWSSHIVWDARLKLGGIRNTRIEDTLYWYDINNWYPPQRKADEPSDSEGIVGVGPDNIGGEVH